MESKYSSVFSSLVSTIRAASGVGAQDISFYRQLDKDLNESAAGASSDLLGLASSIMQAVVPGEVDDLPSNDLNGLNDNWHDISHVLDTLSERIDVALEQHQKGDNDTTADGDASNKPLTLKDGTNGESNANIERLSKNLPKSQNKFKRPVDNSPNKPFKPLLTSKPHAMVPFEESIALTSPSNDDVLVMPHYPQPYQTEILEQDYPKSVWNSADPQPSQPWTSTKVVYVDTQEALDAMVKQLKTAKEIAVDLEHHDYRSFYGFVCLMQISDRKNDFIVDTLVLREELQVLNTVFANPKIIKVFHGASMDIIWLQRDFGLYVVSLFDTYHAACALGLKRHGLAYLLEMYANFQTSKKYQLADWRIRPIPSEMMSYAQSDTHFLLNIYDQIKNELIRRGEEKKSEKLKHVLNESRLTASQRYETPGYDLSAKQQQNPFASSWSSIAYKYNLSPKQQIALKALYEWRDEIARKEDESPRYIMPNHVMVALCTSMPTDTQGILGTANSSSSRTRVYVKNILEVLKAAQAKMDAMDADDAEPEAADDETGSHSTFTVNVDDIEDDFDNYYAKFTQARSKQTDFFSHNPESITKSTSTFWGKTILHPTREPVSIEHLDGLLLVNDIVLTPAASDDEEEEQEAEQEPVAEQEPKNVVYMGQSNTVSNVQMPETAQDEYSETTKQENGGDDDGSVNLSAFGSSGTVLTKSARQRARKLKRKVSSLAAAVSEESSKRSGQSASADNDDDESPAKKARAGTSEDGIPVVAFDYNSAPSVLNRAKEAEEAARKAKKNNNNNKNKNKDAPAPFNPYGSAGDSNVRGARKKKMPAGVGVGRSETFKTKKRK